MRPRFLNHPLMEWKAIVRFLLCAFVFLVLLMLEYGVWG